MLKAKGRNTLCRANGRLRNTKGISLGAGGLCPIRHWSVSGRSVTADGKAHQWCGWRENSSRPSPCLDIATQTPTVENIQFCTDADFDSTNERCERTGTTFTKPLTKSSSVGHSTTPGKATADAGIATTFCSGATTTNGTANCSTPIFCDRRFWSYSRLDYFIEGQLAGSASFTVQ